MTEWAAKRFWKEAVATEVTGGFEVRLDTRPVRTPAKSPLTLPTRALAEAVAAEWEAQDDKIRPDTMPYTRTANAAIDKVAPQRAEVAALLIAYGETDLLCYRAAGPDPLVERQEAGWSPQLQWAAESLGARLITTVGVMPVSQTGAVMDRLSAPVTVMSDFELAAFHDLVSLSGSLVLGLRVAQGDLAASEAWNLSRIDEIYQQEQWGADEEAAAQSEIKHRAFAHAAAFYAACR